MGPTPSTRRAPADLPVGERSRLDRAPDGHVAARDRDVPGAGHGRQHERRRLGGPGLLAGAGVDRPQDAVRVGDEQLLAGPLHAELAGERAVPVEPQPPPLRARVEVAPGQAVAVLVGGDGEPRLGQPHALARRHLPRDAAGVEAIRGESGEQQDDHRPGHAGGEQQRLLPRPAPVPARPGSPQRAPRPAGTARRPRSGSGCATGTGARGRRARRRPRARAESGASCVDALPGWTSRPRGTRLRRCPNACASPACPRPATRTRTSPCSTTACAGTGSTWSTTPGRRFGWLFRNRRRVDVLHFHWRLDRLFRLADDGLGRRRWRERAYPGARRGAAARAAGADAPRSRARAGSAIAWTVHEPWTCRPDGPWLDHRAGRVVARAADVLMAHDHASAELTTPLPAPRGGRSPCCRCPATGS